jgi:hypothetical protein
MRNIKFTLQDVKNYYYGDYCNHIFTYFDITRSNGINRILFVEANFNKKRAWEGMPAREKFFENYGIDKTKLNFMFAGIFYFMVLIPQRLRALFGENVVNDFYLTTRWPSISCGMGGSLPPKETLLEAGLYPCEAEKANFKAMMAVVVPFMVEEIKSFLSNKGSDNIDQEAFNRLHQATSNHIEKLSNDLNLHISDFLEQLN